MFHKVAGSRGPQRCATLDASPAACIPLGAIRLYPLTDIVRGTAMAQAKKAAKKAAKTAKNVKTVKEAARTPKAAKTPKKSVAKSTGRAGRDSSRFICNVVPSKGTEQDWTYADSLAAGALRAARALPASVDLRAPWWTVNNQEDTGSCVGWATADGVLRWHLTTSGRITNAQMLSPRYIWMASKETDQYTNRPESFIEEAGTSLKSALDVARKFGAAMMDELPFHIATKMYTGSENAFYASCAQRKLASYFNLQKNLDQWKSWLASSGPLLVGLNVDRTWDEAATNGGNLDTYQPATVRGGHAVCCVGYRPDGRFIIRNSWDTTWGDGGFGYASPAYIRAAFFNEAYGVTL
jgi:C1A family cysteine protease